MDHRPKLLEHEQDVDVLPGKLEENQEGKTSDEGPRRQVDAHHERGHAAKRFPGAPPASRTDPMEAAIPTQIVMTSALTYCIAS